MSVIYEPAKAEVTSLVDAVMKKYHEPLHKHEVTVGVLMASRSGDDESEDPVLKLHGYPAMAIIKITPYQQRVQGLPDAVIRIDDERWRGLDDDEKAALIDHELCHLTISFDSEGNAKSDDRGRPKLKMRPHDYELGGFDEVERRHGSSSQEQQQWEIVSEKKRQGTFTWG